MKRIRARVTVPEIAEEQQGGHLDRELQLTSNEKVRNPKKQVQIKTMLAQDARAGRVFKELEGALGKHELTMVHGGH